jgi:hypothetical protein
MVAWRSWTHRVLTDLNPDLVDGSVEYPLHPASGQHIVSRGVVVAAPVPLRAPRSAAPPWACGRIPPPQTTSVSSSIPQLEVP